MGHGHLGFEQLPRAEPVVPAVPIRLGLKVHSLEFLVGLDFAPTHNGIRPLEGSIAFRKRSQGQCDRMHAGFR